MKYLGFLTFILLIACSDESSIKPKDSTKNTTNISTYERTKVIRIHMNNNHSTLYFHEVCETKEQLCLTSYKVKGLNSFEKNFAFHDHYPTALFKNSTMRELDSLTELESKSADISKHSNNQLSVDWKQLYNNRVLLHQKYIANCKTSKHWNTVKNLSPKKTGNLLITNKNLSYLAPNGFIMALEVDSINGDIISIALIKSSHQPQENVIVVAPKNEIIGADNPFLGQTGENFYFYCKSGYEYATTQPVTLNKPIDERASNYMDTLIGKTYQETPLGTEFYLIKKIINSESYKNRYPLNLDGAEL